MTSANQSDTKNEIEKILVEVSKSKSIKNYELRPNLDAQIGDGFVSHFYMGEIINKDSGEITNVAIKKQPLGEWDFSTIFKNEITFYTKLFPTLTALQNEAKMKEPFENVPELYCTGSEPKKAYLAMENLKTKGYVLYDKRKYLNKEHLEFIFRTYGKFHALSFVLRKQDFKHYQDIHQEYTDIFPRFAEIRINNFRDSLAAAIDGLDPKSEVCEVAKDLFTNLKAILQKKMIYSGQYRCSTHGDCWSNNMLFKYSEDGKLEDMKLVDFQLARDSSPIHDLSYFFYSGACKNDLNDLEIYLQIYHKAMSEVIKYFGEDPDELFSYDILIEEWKENALLGVLLGMYLWQIKLLAKEEYVDTLKNKKSTVETQSKSFEKLLAKIIESDAYKERTSALLVHAYEFGILRKEKMVMTVEETTASDGPLTTNL